MTPIIKRLELAEEALRRIREAGENFSEWAVWAQKTAAWGMQTGYCPEQPKDAPAAPQQHAQAALSDGQIMEMWISAGQRVHPFARAILAASHQPAAAPAQAVVVIPQGTPYTLTADDVGKKFVGGQQGGELPQDERAAFQQDVNDARFFPTEISFERTLSPSGRDEYKNSHLQSRWEGWQAALAQRAASVPAQAVQPIGYISRSSKAELASGAVGVTATIMAKPLAGNSWDVAIYTAAPVPASSVPDAGREADKADAERYRFLKSVGFEHGRPRHAGVSPVFKVEFTTSDYGYSTGEDSVDAAIDSERAILAAAAPQTKGGA